MLGDEEDEVHGGRGSDFAEPLGMRKSLVSSPCVIRSSVNVNLHYLN